jgi:hypothetical protein
MSGLNQQQRVPRRAFGDITNTTSVDDDVSQVNKGKPIAALSARPYMDRPIDDIDSKDDSNPLLASTYVNQMYVVLQEQEREYIVSHDYMSKQLFINEKMRCILYDWLVSSLKNNHTTSFLLLYIKIM